MATSTKRQQELSQYYTNVRDMQRIARKVNQLAGGGRGPDAVDCFVDFSCGRNQFCQMLTVPTKSVDLMPPGDKVGRVTVKDWTKCTRKNLGIPQKQTVAVGLNPPYGRNCVLAKQFIQHAVNEFQPRFVALVVPMSVKKWMEKQPWFGKHVWDGGDVQEFGMPTGEAFKYPAVSFISRLNCGSFKQNGTNPAAAAAVAARRPRVKDDRFTVTSQGSLPSHDKGLIVRRVGVNCMKHTYCWNSRRRGWVEQQSDTIHDHVLDGTGFAKIELKSSARPTRQRLESLARFLAQHPDPDARYKQPPSTTTQHIGGLVQRWLNKNR